MYSGSCNLYTMQDCPNPKYFLWLRIPSKMCSINNFIPVSVLWLNCEIDFRTFLDEKALLLPRQISFNTAEYAPGKSLPSLVVMSFFQYIKWLTVLGIYHLNRELLWLNPQYEIVEKGYKSRKPVCLWEKKKVQGAGGFCMFHEK